EALVAAATAAASAAFCIARVPKYQLVISNPSPNAAIRTGNKNAIITATVPRSFVRRRVTLRAIFATSIWRYDSLRSMLAVLTTLFWLPDPIQKYLSLAKRTGGYQARRLIFHLPNWVATRAQRVEVGNYDQNPALEPVFSKNPGHLQCTSACPLWAKSGHWPAMMLITALKGTLPHLKERSRGFSAASSNLQGV